MKFKSFLLGMLGAAAIVSCNNNEIDNGTDPQKPGVVEGLPIYATLNLRLNDGAATYAGDGEEAALTPEKKVDNAVVYIYKYDGINTTPENIVYIGTFAYNTTTPPTSTTQGGNQVTLRSTSGRKKVFVALNVNDGTLELVPRLSGDGITPSTAGLVSDKLPASQIFPVVNSPLYSLTATSKNPSGATTNAQAILEKSNALITTLSTAISSTGTGTGGYPNTRGMLMTNWDGPTDAGGGTGTNPALPHLGTCEYELTADVDSVSSFTHAKNNIAINVQRAFAKVSLGISAATRTGSPSIPASNAGFASTGYVAAENDGHEGVFIPWSSGAASTTAIWSMGNIAKFTTPFQQYQGGFVRDYFYNNQGDSLSSIPVNAAKILEYLKHYDNTRIYGTIATDYPAPIGNGTNVDKTKAAMITTGNYQNINTSTLASYVHIPENAREQPTEEYLSAVIIGGKYRPKTVVTAIERNNVPGGATMYYNNPILGTYVNGNDYSYNVAVTDTLYYITDDKTFIGSSDLLKRYYAWMRGGTGVEQTVDKNNPVFGTPTINAINADIANKTILAYANGGTCFYRIFIKQSDTKAEIARNHIYAVNIKEFKGPGMSDPNDFFTPGKSVTAAATYVSAEITVLDWHKVNQDVDADSK